MVYYFVYPVRIGIQPNTGIAHSPADHTCVWEDWKSTIRCKNPSELVFAPAPSPLKHSGNNDCMLPGLLKRSSEQCRAGGIVNKMLST